MVPICVAFCLVPQYLDACIRASKEVTGKVRKMTYTGERLRYDIHAYEEKVKKL
jgi:hypothetical protein